MVALTGVLYWLLTDASFRVTASDVSFEGLRYADEAAVRDHLGGLEREPNVFRMRASEIVEDLRALPEVASAAATVTLPAHVSVRVAEREPLFTWQDGETAWLIDEQGMLFAPLPVGDSRRPAAVRRHARRGRPAAHRIGQPDARDRRQPDARLDRPARRVAWPPPIPGCRSCRTRACRRRRLPSVPTCLPPMWRSCGSCWR